MSNSPRLELVSFKLCPFVQRAAIVLLEKGCDFDVTYIDLQNKPDWFLEISPMGKVPVLRVDGEVLFESAVIAEYLDETLPPRLHPEDPLQRARNRAWIEYSSEMLMDHFRMLKADGEEEFTARKNALTDKLVTLEKNLGDGPFFNGDDFSLADAAFAPGFMRLSEAEKLKPLALLEGLPKTGRWSEHLLGRESVQRSVVAEFPELFRAYLKESGSYFSSLISYDRMNRKSSGSRHDDRKVMLMTIEREVEMTRHLTGRSSLDPQVLKAMGTVPRDEFVPEQSRREAFDNHPLPIGEGQTISQPFMVALMTDLLKPRAQDVILEVGTGSGYQAAILAQLVERVYSVEVITSLAERAVATLKRLGYSNITVSCRDGYQGWEEHAPFDGIVVTAAAPEIPQPLIDQLKPGGRLVIPVGKPYMPQKLLMVEKDEQGRTSTRTVLGVAFVPMVGEKSQNR